ncbi:MAG: lipopolysaccharide heptosyltransferase II, partial [Gammaproteobacteria bacterium]
MVMAQSLFKLLRQQCPDGVIDVLAPGWSLPLLERMPEVADAIEMPVGHGSLELGTRYRLGRSLAGRGYTQAIVLPNSLKSALVPFWARIPRRTGWLGELRYGLLNDIRP